MKTLVKALMVLAAAASALVELAIHTGGNHGAALFMSAAAGAGVGLVFLIVPKVHRPGTLAFAMAGPAAVVAGIAGFFVFGEIWIGGYDDALEGVGMAAAMAGGLLVLYGLTSVALPSPAAAQVPEDSEWP